MIDWAIYITVGIVIGFAAGFFFSRLDTTMQKKCDELEQKLDTAHQEMTHYKQDVTQHFVKTSNLINNMTQSYRAVYDHMADGANKLCSSNMIAQAKNQGELDIPTAKLIETEISDEQLASTETNNTKSDQANINQDTQPESSVDLQQSSEAESEHLHESPPAETVIATPDIVNMTETEAATTPAATSSTNSPESTIDTEIPMVADGSSQEADGSSQKANGSPQTENAINSDAETELSEPAIQNNTLHDKDKKDSTIMH